MAGCQVNFSEAYNNMNSWKQPCSSNQIVGQKFPDEIFKLIFGHIEQLEILNFSGTCKKFRSWIQLSLYTKCAAECANQILTQVKEIEKISRSNQRRDNCVDPDRRIKTLEEKIEVVCALFEGYHRTVLNPTSTERSINFINLFGPQPHLSTIKVTIQAKTQSVLDGKSAYFSVFQTTVAIAYMSNISVVQYSNYDSNGVVKYLFSQNFTSKLQQELNKIRADHIKWINEEFALNGSKMIT